MGRKIKSEAPKPNTIEIVDDQDQLCLEGSSAKPQKKSNKMISKANNKKQPVQNSDSTEIGNQVQKSKRGRPKKSQRQLQVAEDPSCQIQRIILQYLENIGLKHGLVFRAQERKVLNQESRIQGSNIKWTKQHEWKKQIQLQKLGAEKHVRIINQFLQTLGNKLTAEHITLIILNISCLMAQECTGQFYDIVDEILTSLNLNESIGQVQKRGTQLFNKIIFMTGKFTNKKILYWLQIEQDQNKIKSNFIETFKKLCHYFDICFKSTDLVIKFVEEQKEMDQLLEMIIDGKEEGQMIDEKK